MAERLAWLRSVDPMLERLGEAIADLVAAGGKRLRPAFVYWGHRATGADHDEAVFTPAGAVELVHAFALIHDDVMDRSPTRRGAPATHVGLADTHRTEGRRGDADWFGVSAAVLAGDLATAWASHHFDEADFPAHVLGEARKVFTILQSEVIAGQYLELWQTGGSPDAEDVRRVGLLKSGRYTITRPLELGAAFGRRHVGLDRALRRYGDALGIAFQLRDDVLGLFGDPTVTGKSTLVDLREGKRTLLVVLALERAGSAERSELERRLGNPDATDDDAAVVRQIVVSTEALHDVETLLTDHRRHAGLALETVPSPACDALAELADLVVERSA